MSPPGKDRPRRTGARIAARVLLCVALICAAAARGQSSTPSKADAAPADELRLGSLEISGEWRVRLEGWDWFRASTGQNTYAFPHSLLRIAVGQRTKSLDWQLEAAQDAILLLPRDAVVALPQGQLGPGGTYYAANGNGRNNVNGFVKQAYVQIHRVGRGNLKLGRFEYFDGAEVKPRDPTLASLVQTRISQRLIGNFGFSAVQRSYDGAQFSYNFDKDNLTLFGARTTKGVYQIDGLGELDVDVYSGALTVPISTAHSAGELRVFGLGYIDHRTKVLKTDNRPQAVRAADHGEIQIGTYGADYLHVFHTETSGTFDLLAWGAVQTGAWGQLQQRAGAFVSEFGWQPQMRTLKPWLSVGYSYGSGDGNSSDSVHKTFFQILPTPRIYARMPFYNMENNEDFYGSLNLKPHAKVAMRSELHALRLASRDDLWYLGGGAFQPQTFGYTGRPSNGHGSLANVWDVSGEYQVTRTLTFGLYYAHAWGKATIASIYPKGADGQFAYFETDWRF